MIDILVGQLTKGEAERQVVESVVLGGVCS